MLACRCMLLPMQTLLNLSNTGKAGVCTYRKNTMNILNEYPGPWSVTVNRKKTRSSVEILDYNETPVATIYGETEEQAVAIAKLICQVPENIFERQNY